MRRDFRTYVGSVVRFQVDINVESWDVVNDGLKDAIWDDIKNRWKLDDSHKKNVLERAGKQWRDFKGKLTKNYLRKEESPCEKYHFITEEMWEIFKKRRETEEFEEISEKAKESQKQNEHVHYLGPAGHVGQRSKRCSNDPVTSLNDSEYVNPSILSSERNGRSYDWVRARTKPREGGGYYFPNEKTKEVFEKMGELQNQVSDGSWTPQGHDGILSRALDRKEHGGHVRGVGRSAKIKDVFESGKNKHNGVVSVDDLATITQEITKKVQKEFEEKMNAKLKGVFNHLKEIGVSLPDDIGTPKNEFFEAVAIRWIGKIIFQISSYICINFLVNYVHLSLRTGYFLTKHLQICWFMMQIPTLCRLCVMHLDSGRVVVVRGTVFPSNSQGTNMLHNSPIAPYNVKVS